MLKARSLVKISQLFLRYLLLRGEVWFSLERFMLSARIRIATDVETQVSDRIKNIYISGVSGVWRFYLFII